MNVISTDKAPGAIGPYSQATTTDSVIYTSGQLPINPQTGELAEGIAAQTKQSLQNVKNILESVGSSMSNVLKTTVYLANMEDFAQMNEVYATFFENGNYPARSAFQVARLPKDALVEIEVVASK